MKKEKFRKEQQEEHQEKQKKRKTFHDGFVFQGQELVGLVLDLVGIFSECLIWIWFWDQDEIGTMKLEK